MRFLPRMISRVVVLTALVFALNGVQARAADDDCDFCNCLSNGRETCDTILDTCVTCDPNFFPCGCSTYCDTEIYNYWCVLPN
jgi:hypothetical protein